MKNQYQHRAIKAKTQTRCFVQPVAWPGNPAAHGNITQHDVCACGARRAE